LIGFSALQEYAFRIFMIFGWGAVLADAKIDSVFFAKRTVNSYLKSIVLWFFVLFCLLLKSGPVDVECGRMR